MSSPKGSRAAKERLALSAGVGDGVLESVIADGAIHHAVADDEQWRARSSELARDLEVALELGFNRRVVRSGDSYLGQSPLEPYFGLGPYTAAPIVDVRWPGGATTNLVIPANAREMTVSEVRRER